MGQGRFLPVAAVLAALSAGCMSSSGYTEQADAEVGALLDRVQSDTLSGRAAWVQQPAPAPEPPPPPPAPTPPDAGDKPADSAAGDEPPKTAGRATEAELTAPLDSTSPDALHLDLRTALHTAVTSGREFTNRRESLYLEGLSLSLTRYNFGPILNGTLGLLWNDSKKSASTAAATASLGMTQILDTGGSFTLGGNLSANHAAGKDVPDDPLWNSGLSFDLSQPLMRGSGYMVSHESLTQAERSIVYEVRDFELFREDFAIDVARDFFDLVSRRKRIVNLEQSWRDAVFDVNKSHALRQVDRNRDEDVFLARRRGIDAENTLIEARTDYRLALDDFKIKLGLTTSADVTIVDQDPPYEVIKLDEDSAVEVALHNRLDLVTARERLEDTERGVLIAEDALRPDLNLSVGYGASASNGELLNAIPDSTEASAALTLELPLNRQAQRNSWRSSLIGLDRARRDLQLQFDGVERDVRNQLRALKQTEQQIELQKEQIAQEQRAVAVTQIYYEAGERGSRDLLDARQSLVTAQNNLIDLLARHVIARLTLLRTLGVLSLDDDGMWTS